MKWDLYCFNTQSQWSGTITKTYMYEIPGCLFLSLLVGIEQTWKCHVSSRQNNCTSDDIHVGHIPTWYVLEALTIEMKTNSVFRDMSALECEINKPIKSPVTILRFL